MENFRALDLPKALTDALDKMGFATPTPIQAAAIPPALKGQDILGSAQTGTGKTGAFGVPLVAHLLADKNAGALVMTPTRELAAQVLKALEQMLAFAPGLHAALLIGGDSMHKQLQQLKRRPRLIVGTPGRINDHLSQGTVSFAQTGFLVLDEMDKMLDMGFDVQIEKIIRTLPKKRQTLMFSATMPPNIVRTSEKYLQRPARVAVGSTHSAAPKITQELIQVQQAEKYGVLGEQLKARSGSIIIFVKTKRGADRMARKLLADGHSADAIHGDMNQNKRNRVIDKFRKKECRILVATDVAARGLDIPHIEHVINHDLPQVPEDYIHRIGRTARAGAEGAAVCLISPEERDKWRDIHFLMNPQSRREPELKPSRQRSLPDGTRNYAEKRPRGFRRQGAPQNDRADRADRGERSARPPRRDNRDDGSRSDRYDRNDRNERNERGARTADRNVPRRKSTGFSTRDDYIERPAQKAGPYRKSPSKGKSYAQGKPAQGKPAQGKTGYGKNSQSKNSQGKPAQGKTGYSKTGYGKSGAGDKTGARGKSFGRPGGFAARKGGSAGGGPKRNRAGR